MCMRFFWSLTWALPFYQAGKQPKNLFQNADFEEPFRHSNWWCGGCDALERSTDSHQGQYSASISGRTQQWQGVTQNLNLEPNRKYLFSIYIKLLNHKNLAERVKCLLTVHYEDGQQDVIILGREPYLRQSEGWQQVGGDAHIADKAVSKSRFTVQLPDVALEYLVDTASLTEITLDDDWREQADKQIKQNRKNNVILNVDVGGYDPSTLSVEVRQVYQHFPFGAALQASKVPAAGPQYDLYRDIFFENFNWAVMTNSMKWQVMERRKDMIDFDTADKAIAVLRAKGIKVRGHNMFWGVEKWVPKWLKSMTADQVRTEVDRRIEYAGQHYSGVVEHWDVNNEQLHGSFYEVNIGDMTLLAKMFSKLRAQDPNSTLFLNDFDVVIGSGATYAMLKSAKQLQAQGAPIGAIGVQCHFKSFPDIARVKTRLDVLAAAGLPIWVTELTVELVNITSRTKAYEDLLRLFYSHPSVEGIVFWGFWDQDHRRPTASLVDGDYLQVNEAGRRVFDLIGNKWKTSADFQPSSHENRFEFPGFHGNYEVRVKLNGTFIKTETFTLNKGQDTTVTVNM